MSLTLARSDVVDFSAKNTHFGNIWNSLNKEDRIQKETPLNPNTDIERYRKFLNSLSSKGEASINDFIALMGAKDSAIFPITKELFAEIDEMFNSTYFSSDNLLAKVGFYFKESIRGAAIKI